MIVPGTPILEENTIINLGGIPGTGSTKAWLSKMMLFAKRCTRDGANETRTYAG